MSWAMARIPCLFFCFKEEEKMKSVPESFGSLVFDLREMRARLSSQVFKSLENTIENGMKLDINVANSVANTMKEWAIEHGATHFTHWFQPLTGITAEKHESFIAPSPDGGVIMEFSGKELIKGEPDASSFPSGGLRATFEARGYTAWDPTSYAFIKDRTLYIPTAFCSYGGEALDKKTPLLRSMEALGREALRILRLFGNTDAKHVVTSVGAEQEYFLIDEELYIRRPDLIYTGRTLFGAMSPKGQELEDHYFGSIKPRVKAFMEDVDEELWKLGILAKTEHNEVAPAQHELAPIFTTTNRACDQNQLTMEMLQKIASRHGLVCLLHEKPFKGVNGSGKHNNWSIATDTGINLLSPGDTPYENAQFLLFLSAVIKAVDDYQDLLRLSVATAGNDHRLGANEAPPAIVSIFVGEELMEILDSIADDRPYKGHGKVQMMLGADVLPRFQKDTTDRNRTSPFAFTGNKFEFRMLGSSNSIACANIMLNSAVANSLRIFADRLEAAENFDAELRVLIRETIRKHRRIIFNGNGYDESWKSEAKRRGLLEMRTTPEAIVHLLDEKNVKMLTESGIYSLAELESRTEITLENYSRTVLIEAATMIDMARRMILPAVGHQLDLFLERLLRRKDTGTGSCSYEERLIEELTDAEERIDENARAMQAKIARIKAIGDKAAQATEIAEDLIPSMDRLREAADAAESLTSKEFWPLPSYGELMFSVR